MISPEPKTPPTCPQGGRIMHAIAGFEIPWACVSARRVVSGPQKPPFSNKISRQNPRGPFPKPFFRGNWESFEPFHFSMGFWGLKVEILGGWAPEILNIAIGQSPFSTGNTSSFMVDFSASHVSFRGGGGGGSTLYHGNLLLIPSCLGVVSPIFSRLKSSIFPWVFWGPKVEITWRMGFHLGCVVR